MAVLAIGGSEGIRNRRGIDAIGKNETRRHRHPYGRNDADRSVSVVHQIEDPEGRARGRKRGSTLSGSRPVSSSEVSPHEEARHRLNHGVARFLDRAQEAGTVSYLVLIGEPGVLGDVRNDLNAKVRKMIIREIHRDWTHRKGEGLLRQAAQVFEEHR